MSVVVEIKDVWRRIKAAGHGDADGCSNGLHLAAGAVFLHISSAGANLSMMSTWQTCIGRPIRRMGA